MAPHFVVVHTFTLFASEGSRVRKFFQFFWGIFYQICTKWTNIPRIRTFLDTCATDDEDEEYDPPVGELSSADDYDSDKSEIDFLEMTDQENLVTDLPTALFSKHETIDYLEDAHPFKPTPSRNRTLYKSITKQRAVWMSCV